MIRPHHLLRPIGRGKATFRGLLLRISSKLISCKLTAVVTRTELFEVHVVLSLSTRRICPTDLKGFVFRPEWLKPSVASMIISKSHIIPTSSEAKSERKAPNVGINFFTKTWLCCSLLTYSICLRVVLKYSQESQMKGGKSLITRTPVIEPARISERTASTEMCEACQVPQPVIKREN